MTRRRAVTAATAAALLLAGCAGDLDASLDSGEVSPTSGGQGGGTAAPPADPEGTDAATGDDLAPQAAADRALTGREIVRRADITLEFDDPDVGVDEVTRVTEAAGGFVATADLQRNERTGDLGGIMTLRIPSDRLVTTLTALEEIAVDAPVRRIDTEDVTAQAVDLRAQIRNLTAYETELRALLTEVREGTSDPDRLLPLFDRVQSVRSDIDRLTAQLAGLEDRVALSTVTVTLRPTRGAEPVATTPGWTPGRTFQEALAATLRFATGLADALIWLSVTLIPVLLVLFAPPAAIWWVWNRRRQERAALAPPPPTGPAASPVGDAAGAADEPPSQDPPAPND